MHPHPGFVCTCPRIVHRRQYMSHVYDADTGVSIANQNPALITTHPHRAHTASVVMKTHAVVAPAPLSSRLTYV